MNQRKKTDNMRKNNVAPSRLLTQGMTLVLMVVMLISTASIAFAGEVSYEGKADGFVFSPGSSRSATDLFTNFKDIVPGDTANDSVDVVNNSKNTVKIYMRATGHAGGSASFLDQMDMTVTQSGGNKLFEAASGDKGSLANWTLLGTMKPGAKATLDIGLTVPLSMGNDYQDAMGQVGWQFKVEEIGKDGGSSGDGGGSKTTTGDRVMIGAALLLLLAAAFGTSYVIRRRRSAIK